LFTLKYERFLPENVMINVLSHYGPYSKDKVYQNSIHFTEKITKSGCIIDTDFDKKQIEVYTGWDDNALTVGKAVYEKFMTLSKKAQLFISVDDGEHWVPTKGLMKDLNDGRDIKDKEGNWLENTSGFTFLKEKMEHKGFPEPSPVQKSGDNALNMEDIKAQVRELVSRARPKDAIQLLIAHLNGAYKNEAIKLKGDQAKLDRDVRVGVLSHSEAGIQQSKITSAVLELVQYIGTEDTTPIPQEIITAPPVPAPGISTRPEQEAVPPKNENMSTKNSTLITVGIIAAVLIILLAMLDYSGKINIFGLFDIEATKNTPPPVEVQDTPPQPQLVSVKGTVLINDKRATSDEVTDVLIKGNNSVKPVALTSKSQFMLEDVEYPEENHLLKIAVVFKGGFEEYDFFKVKDKVKDGVIDVGDVRITYKAPPASAPDQRPIIKMYNKNIVQNSINIDSDNSGNQQIED
jgi:hypothetical protein